MNAAPPAAGAPGQENAASDGSAEESAVLRARLQVAYADLAHATQNYLNEHARAEALAGDAGRATAAAADLSARLAAREAAAAQDAAAIAERDALAQSLRAELAALEGRLAGEETARAELIAALDAERRSREGERERADAAQAQVAERDAVVQSLRAGLLALESRLADADAARAELVATLDAERRSRDAERERADAAQAQVAERDATIATLRAELAACAARLARLESSALFRFGGRLFGLGEAASRIPRE